MKQLKIEGMFRPDDPGISLFDSDTMNIPLLIPYNIWVEVEDYIADYMKDMLEDRAEVR